MNVKQASLLEIAIDIMENTNTTKNIYELIKEVLATKGLEDTDGTLAAQLYVDITTSSKFVYMGEDEWDLKIRQSLDFFDKDGSTFNSKDDEYIDEDDDDLDENDADEDFEDDFDDEDDEEDEDFDDEDESSDDEESDDYDTEDEESDDYEESDDDFEEEKYNEYMDDYEDMYGN